MAATGLDADTVVFQVHSPGMRHEDFDAHMNGDVPTVVG